MKVLDIFFSHRLKSRKAKGEVWREEAELFNTQFLDLLGDQGKEMLSNASKARNSVKKTVTSQT